MLVVKHVFKVFNTKSRLKMPIGMRDAPNIMPFHYTQILLILVMDIYWICWIGALDFVGWIGFSTISNPNPI